MSAGPDPRAANAQMIEQERRRLSQRLDEVARLCESGVPPATFYSELLQRLLESLAAVAGSVWLRTSQGNLQQQFQINLQQVGLDGSNEESRQAHDALLRAAFTNGQPIHLPPNSSIGQPEPNKPTPGNPTPCILLLVPIRQQDQVVGLLEVFQGPNRPQNAIPGFLQYMSLMADLAGRYHRNQMVSALSGQQQLWTQLESFARTIHGSLNPTEVAILVANEGRRLVDCDRISVAVRRGGEKARIEAVSGTDIVEHRSNLIRTMRKLSEEVLNWGEKLTFEGTRDDALPPKVLDALDAYLSEAHTKMLVISPLRDEREGDGKDKPRLPPRSALIMECFETPMDSAQTIAKLDVVAKHSTPALYNALEHRRIPMRFLWMPLAKLQEGLGGKTKSIVMLCVALASMLLAALYALPYPLKMEATGTVMPVVRRTVYAPAPGTIERFEVSPNEYVNEGRSLALMYDSTLFQKYNTLYAEMKAAEQEASDLESRVEREQVEGEKRTLRSRAALRRADQESKRLEINELVRRTNMLRAQPGFFALLAPPMSAEERRMVQDARWLILTSNFQEKKGGEIKPNEPIMRVGVKEGPQEIELKIPQKHMGQILRAFTRLNTDHLEVDFLLLGSTMTLYKGLLFRDRIAGEANPNQEDANESEPTVLAYVDIESDRIPKGFRVPREELTSGTEVRAKVRCGNARSGYSLFYGVYEFLYEKVVFYLF
ncbi:MAG: GAF domain-containing protein [Gemmataceae bacterium]